MKLLSTLGVMYKFTADPVGEFGLDFLTGCVNSRLSCVEEDGFLIPSWNRAEGEVTLRGVILWKEESELLKFPKLPSELLVLSLLSELLEPKARSLWK